MLDLSEVVSDVFADLDIEIEEDFEDDDDPVLARWGWWLSYLGKAFGRARRLEENRADYIRSLYSDVRLPSVNYGHEYKRGEGNPAPDAQAFRIIRKKQIYERMINKQYRLHRTWHRVLSLCDTERDEVLMVQYFFKDRPISERSINQLLQKMHRSLLQLERTVEDERDWLAIRGFEEMDMYERFRQAAASSASDIEYC